MEAALYHPQYGYYCREEFAIGRHGDFTTAPEMSVLFAKCIARQCAQVFEHLGCAAILEVGAGTGKLAQDLIAELKKMGHMSLSYFIYEPNLPLREKQKTMLQHETVMWLDILPDAFEGVIIANEVLDALPVHCFRIEENQIKERCVTWQNNTFAWQLTEPTSHLLTPYATKLRELYMLPVGYESEINLRLDAFIHSLTTALHKGVMLLFDYGYGQREYYHPERRRGTLSCFYQHRYHHDPLILIGQQDMTAHVDFTRVVENAIETACSLEGFTSQAAFLLSCGLMTLAMEEEKNLSPTDSFQVHQAIKILTLPTEMGERIKVMALGKKIELALLGFSLQDRRRDL